MSDMRHVLKHRHDAERALLGARHELEATAAELSYEFGQGRIDHTVFASRYAEANTRFVAANARFQEAIRENNERAERLTSSAVGGLVAVTPEVRVSVAHAVELRDQLDLPDHGHGHVYPREDGATEPCGGPSLCSECEVDQTALRDAALVPDEELPAHAPAPAPTQPAKLDFTDEEKALLRRSGYDPADVYSFESEQRGDERVAVNVRLRG